MKKGISFLINVLMLTYILSTTTVTAKAPEYIEIELPEIVKIEEENDIPIDEPVDENLIVLEEIEEITEEVSPLSLYSQEEIDLLARVVMSEASILCFEGKQAVAETILNRVADDRWPDTVSEVIFQKNQFSTADNGAPNEDCYRAVKYAILDDSFPDDMLWFRLWHVDYGEEYYICGNTIFCTEYKY